MSAADGLKVEAVGRIVERLLRLAAEHALSCPAGVDCEATTPVGPLASELRAIVDAVVPTGKTPTEHAMLELGVWSARYESLVGRESLIGVLFCEAAMSCHEAGQRRSQFLDQCARAWDSLRVTLNALEAAGLSDVRVVADEAFDFVGGVARECGDTDCSACAQRDAAALEDGESNPNYWGGGRYE